MNKYEAGASNWKDEDVPDFMPEEGNFFVRSLIFIIKKKKLINLCFYYCFAGTKKKRTFRQ